jgi:uncharacterized protein YgiM (DUF1202 family)
MSYDAIVRSAHRTQYPDAIRLQAGDRVTVGKRDEEYPGWIWTTVASGKSAWVPEGLLEVSGTDAAVARVDYESTELNTEAGEAVRVVFEMLDWAWVKNAAGAAGWVPLNTIRAA